MELVTGPKSTNPYGYVKGPVAKSKFTIVADAAKGVIGFMVGLTLPSRT